MFLIRQSLALPQTGCILPQRVHTACFYSIFLQVTQRLFQIINMAHIYYALLIEHLKIWMQPENVCSVCDYTLNTPQCLSIMIKLPPSLPRVPQTSYRALPKSWLAYILQLNPPAASSKIYQYNSEAHPRYRYAACSQRLFASSTFFLCPALNSSIFFSKWDLEKSNFRRNC